MFVYRILSFQSLPPPSLSPRVSQWDIWCPPRGAHSRELIRRWERFFLTCSGDRELVRLRKIERWVSDQKLNLWIERWENAGLISERIVPVKARISCAPCRIGWGTYYLQADVQENQSTNIEFYICSLWQSALVLLFGRYIALKRDWITVFTVSRMCALCSHLNKSVERTRQDCTSRCRFYSPHFILRSF